MEVEEDKPVPAETAQQPLPVVEKVGESPSEESQLFLKFKNHVSCGFNLKYCPGNCMFFPTSLCGVLVFGSASRPPPPAPVPLPSPPHTQLAHTQLTCKHNLLTHNLHTHTTCQHTTCTHTHTYSHTQLTHTQLTHTQLAHFLRGRRGTWRHVAALCVAGVAL